MQCPYLNQKKAKTILTGFLGGDYSGAQICVAHEDTKFTNSFCDQVCRKNNAQNCMHCNYHSVKQ